MTDEKAIEGCKRQDRICQKHLFDTLSGGMLMVCMRYVKNLADAEELMLSGFYQFYRSIDRFVYKGKGSIAAWLRKIIVNECLMFLRKKGEIKITDEKQALEIAAGDDQLERMSAAEIYQLVTQLPPGYRTVFNLYAIEGYSHKEIAAMLSISEGTSKSQLNKARLQLQKTIKEGCYEK